MGVQWDDELRTKIAEILTGSARKACSRVALLRLERPRDEHVSRKGSAR